MRLCMRATPRACVIVHDGSGACGSVQCVCHGLAGPPWGRGPPRAAWRCACAAVSRQKRRPLRGGGRGLANRAKEGAVDFLEFRPFSAKITTPERPRRLRRKRVGSPLPAFLHAPQLPKPHCPGGLGTEKGWEGMLEAILRMPSL